VKQPKYSDAQIWAAWITTRNVLAVAAEVGCSESAAYARLKKLGATFAPIGRPKGYKPTKAETPRQVNSAALAAKQIAGEFANVPLGQWLVDAGPPPVLPSAKKDPDAAKREQEQRESWWLPTCECLEIEMFPGAVSHYEYAIRLCTNQRLTRGDVEQIFVIGIPGMHRRRGERAPCDCIAAQDGDDDAA
jgi:hypothetical protein